MSKRRLNPQRVPGDVLNYLNEAEKEARQFNSTYKKDKGNIEAATRSVYKAETFSMSNEMSAMQQNNIVSKELAEQNIKEFDMSKEPAKMEQDAIAAVQAAGFSAQQTEAPAPQEATKSEETEEEEEKEGKPLTEEEKFEIVAKEFADRFGEGAPSIEVLQQWKRTFGAIFALDLGDKNMFIYRYLNRQEWQQMNAPDSDWLKSSPMKKEEYIVGKCLLFPAYTPEGMRALPAGMFSMLTEQIQLQSMFLPPAQVAEITMKI